MSILSYIFTFPTFLECLKEGKNTHSVHCLVYFLHTRLLHVASNTGGGTLVFMC